MPSSRFRTVRSATSDMPLDDVVGRLAGDARVAGLAVMGSVARGAASETSDVDLVVVLKEPAPLLALAPGMPFEVVFTYVDGRPADVIVTTPSRVRDAASEPLWRWLQGARVLLDRDGAIDAVRAAASPAPWTPDDAFAAWWEVSFSVIKAERYAAAGDTRYREAAAWIATAAGDAALRAYFTVRGLPWAGEKEAIAHWSRGDEAFLALFRRLLEGGTAGQKASAARAVAEHALDPVGGVWNPGTGPRSEVWETLTRS